MVLLFNYKDSMMGRISEIDAAAFRRAASYRMYSLANEAWGPMTLCSMPQLVYYDPSTWDFRGGQRVRPLVEPM
jgi:hypothetical protein